jgi:vancomycin resistance protein VanJ
MASRHMDLEEKPQTLARIGPHIPPARIIDTLGWAYVGGLTLWAIARVIAGDRLLAVLVLNYLGVWVFLPLLFFGPWVLLWRRKHGGFLLLIPAAMFVWHYGPLLIPRSAQTASPNSVITVMTYNLRYDNVDTDALLSTMLASGADVLALQEVSSYHRVHMSTALSKQYPHSFYHSRAGLAIYSLYPIVAQRMLPMEPQPAQSAVIEAPHASFHLVNAHLARVGILSSFGVIDGPVMVESATRRDIQVVRILGAVQEMGLPTIVACDCNMTDLTTAYGRMTRALDDAYRERGWGFGNTFLVPRGIEIPSSVNVPVQRIDYLFLSPDIRVTQAKVLDSKGGSDHLPLFGQFDLTPQHEHLVGSPG